MKTKGLKGYYCAGDETSLSRKYCVLVTPRYVALGNRLQVEYRRGFSKW